MFYFAGPMDEEYKRRNEKLVSKLEKLGFKIYLPQRDTNQGYSARRIFMLNMSALKRSDAVIVVLSNTRGVYLETGYAKALGKTLIGFMVEETKELGPITRNFFNHIVNDVDGLSIILEKTPKKHKILKKHKKIKKTMKKERIINKEKTGRKKWKRSNKAK
jgi:nucleoside 2-deoxyribosyltransferase